MRRLLLPSVLAIVILIVTLAGLLGVIQVLSNARGTVASPDNDISSSGSDLPITPGILPTNGPRLSFPALPSIPAGSHPASTSINPTPSSAPITSNTPKPSGATPTAGTIPSMTPAPQPFSSLPAMNGLGTDISQNISPEGGLLPAIPLFQVSGAAHTPLLRTTVTSNYDGKTWSLDSNARSVPYDGRQLPSSVTGFSQKIADLIKVARLGQFPSTLMPLPNALNTTSLSAALPLNYLPDEQLFMSPQGIPDAYSFQTNHYDFDPSKLNGAPLDIDPKYLQLPPSITPRTKQLAQEITKNQPTPFQKAQAIEDYLKNNYAYDLEYQKAPAGQEPNDWFLFDEKKGVCSNFNSAFVTLARSAGIPSRLVGGYSLQPTSDTQTVTADKAHAWSEVKFKDLGWVPFDATGTGSGPIATLTEITSIQSQAQKGHDFIIQGTVVTSGGEPVDGVPLEIFLNSRKETTGGIPIGNGTVSAGRFNIVTTIPQDIIVGNYQVLAHCLGGNKYGESWSDPQIKVVTGTNINLEISPKVLIQQEIAVKGRLNEEFSKPVSGQRLDIYLDNRLDNRVITDKDGQFTWQHSFDSAGEYTFKVNYTGTEYFLQSSREVKVQALIPSAVILQIPDEVLAGKPAVIEGSLIDTVSRDLLPGRTVLMLLDEQELDDVLTTDEQGNFRLEHEFDEAGDYNLEARFAGDSLHWETSTSANIRVLAAAGGGFPWLYLIVGVFLAIIGTVGYLFYRRRKRRIPETNSPVVRSALIPEFETPQAEVKLSGILLRIELPQIESPFPDVWGLNEELEVIYYLADERGKELAGKPLEVTGINGMTRMNTDAQGRISVKFLFSQKGQYKMTARYLLAAGTGNVIAERTIRVVDYREEIVNLYRSLLDWFRDLGTDISVRATPREVERTVARSGKKMSGTDLDTAITRFEEADYSLHTIERWHYESIYWAQSQLREHDRESKVKIPI